MLNSLFWKGHINLYKHAKFYFGTKTGKKLPFNKMEKLGFLTADFEKCKHDKMLI